MADSVAPISGLNLSFNATLMYVELFDFWHSKWKALETVMMTPQKRKETATENAERVMAGLTQCLVRTMSSIEFAAKNALLTGALSQPQLGKERIYLSTIMQKSFNTGLIGQEDQNLWVFVNHLRNALVHNNGIAEKETRLVLPSGLSLQSFPETMTQSSISGFLELLEQVVQAYARWCEAVLAIGPVVSPEAA